MDYFCRFGFLFCLTILLLLVVVVVVVVYSGAYL